MIKSTEETIKEVKKKTGETTLLSFSGGKDSTCAYLAIKDHFKKIIPYHLYLIPGLSFVEEHLSYCEEMMHTKIIRVPAIGLYRMLKNYVFQPPGRLDTIDSFRLITYTHQDVHDLICDDQQISKKTYTAIGIRAPDSQNRRMSIEKHGTINHNLLKYYPVADWNKERLISEIKQSGWKLSVEYKLFGRSFDGLDLRFLFPIRDQYPDDYQKILDWFPFAEFEIKRYEYSLKG